MPVETKDTTHDMSDRASPSGPSAYYPVIEASTEPAALERLRSACAHTRFETCLIAPSSSKTLDAAIAGPFIELLQSQGIAAIIADDAALARTMKADGVHVSWRKDISAAFEEAREIVGGRFIVGVDAGRSRHDAMQLGEAGADYVAFGIPPEVQDRETAAPTRLELINRWSEIIEIPCVGFDVENPAAAELLADAGSDFVSAKLPAGMAGAELNGWLDQMNAALARQTRTGSTIA